MMSTYAKTEKKPERFDLYVKKIRSICDMHNVPFGSPEDLSAFMQKLAEDRHFAMDFWALTGALSSREGGQLSDEQMLAVIVEGVAGGDISEHDEELKQLIDDLASMLAGVDVHSPSGQNHVEPAPFPSARSNSPVSPPQVARRAEREVPESYPATRFVAPSALDGEPRADLPPPAALPPQLDEALLRLELNSLELKLHLDSIDSRMSRLEPHLEELTSIVASPERIRKPLEEEPLPAESFAEAVRRPSGNSRLVLEPTVPPSRDAASDWDDPSIHVPLESYSQPEGRGRFVFLAVFVLVMAGAIFAFQRYRTQLQEGYSVVVQKIHDAAAANSSNQSARQTNAPASAPVAVPAAAQNSSTTPSVSNGTPSAPAANVESTTTPPQPAAAASAATPPAGSSLDRRSRRIAMLNRAAAAEAEDAAAHEDLSSADTAGAVKVAPAVMEANLIASRVPAYPEIAKADRIEGPVVAQAIISKGGTVERVHVIQGDPLLRNAAADAIHKWRYRPYMLNGEPVQVATTITIDFKLDR